METETGRSKARASGYADVNGLHMYYEEHGEGSPLVLLHGGMLTIDLSFGTLVPALAGQHQVTGVELLGPRPHRGYRPEDHACGARQ